MAKQQGSKKDPTRRHVSVRIDDALHTDLTEFAEAEGITVSDVVRSVLQGSQKQFRSATAGRARRTQQTFVTFTKDALESFGEFTEELEGMRLDIRRIGVNLNQIAKRLNQGSSISLQEIRAAVQPVRRVQEDVADLVLVVSGMANAPGELYRREEDKIGNY